MELVQLVDELDNNIGIMEKMQAHREAKLHRAVSVFIFNSKGELLLQRRAKNKYHSGNLWTNTCCSHPRPEEPTLDAVKRRLFEEMGMQCHLEHQFEFIYKAELDNHITEYEYDHVFFGECDSEPLINTEEVSEWTYMSMEDTEQLLNESPELFTIWFKLIFDKVKELRK